MVARQNHQQRLFCNTTKRQPCHSLFAPKKSRIQFFFQQRFCKFCRILARYQQVNIRQFVAQDLQCCRHPCELVSGQKAHREAWPRRMSHPACGFHCRFNLCQHGACVFKKGLARRRQLDAASAARQQLGADFFFEVPDLPAQRRLCGVQLRLCRNGNTLRLGDRDKITQVSQFHLELPCSRSIVGQLTKYRPKVPLLGFPRIRWSDLSQLKEVGSRIRHAWSAWQMNKRSKESMRGNRTWQRNSKERLLSSPAVPAALVPQSPNGWPKTEPPSPSHIQRVRMPLQIGRASC